MLPYIRKRSILRVSQSEVKESVVRVNGRVLNIFKIVYRASGVANYGLHAVLNNNDILGIGFHFHVKNIHPKGL